MKPKLRYLSFEEIDLVHNAALEILAQVGMRLPSKEALELLEGAGCWVENNGIVRIPPDLVTKAVHLSPKRDEVVLYGLDPVYDINFKTHKPYLACMTMATSVLDPFTGKKRPATVSDLEDLVYLADRIEKITINGGLVTPQDVPGEINDWFTWAVCLKNTTKHITGGVLGRRGVKDAVAMATAAAGGERAFRARPHISGWVLTMPPLSMENQSLEALIELARQGVPIMLSSGPITGMSSSVTLAGTLVQAHAEILGALTVAQLAAPGATVIYTSFARGMDMKTSQVTMASPEFAILKAAMAQLGAHIDLPVRMPAMLRDAKILDAQAGFETGLVGALTSVVADIMDGMQLDMDQLVDFADLYFCSECMGALERLARPLNVDRESMALDIIAEVGPGGNYIGHRHTFENFRNELWAAEIFERGHWEGWNKDGSRDIRAVCLERTLDMLSHDRKPILSREVEDVIDSIVDAARRDLTA